MLQIYCGDGKGKTTAALGLALRCAGSGKKVHIMQFMKGNISSEIYALRQIDNITVQRCDKNYGFTKTMTSADKTGITACHNEMLSRAQSLIAEHKADMLILDEFNNAFHYGLLDKSLAEKVILSASLSAEIVLTGRNPDPKFLEKADYISEIHCIKHPFGRGITARKGIEF